MQSKADPARVPARSRSAPARIACLALGGLWLAFIAAIPFGGTEAIVLSGVVGLCYVMAALGGAFVPRAGIHARCVHAIRTRSPHVALTFDDGPDPIHTRAVLDVLERHGASATFFVIGARAHAQKDLIADLAARGHQVETHSWFHSPWCPFKPAHKVAEELTRAANLIASLTGRRPEWFRPPYGVVSPPTALGARMAGLTLCHWSTTGRDGRRHQTRARAFKKIQRRLEPGAIVVLHDGQSASTHQPIAASVLEDVLCEMRKRGLVPVTLDQLARSNQECDAQVTSQRDSSKVEGAGAGAQNDAARIASSNTAPSSQMRSTRAQLSG